jgi:type VI secretion system secreted protein Hcp
MAGKIFAKIGDIKGESRDTRHKDEIDVLSWSWGLTQSVAPGRGGGGGAGKATFSDLTFVHNIDKASPILFKTCATGTHIPEAVLTARKAGRGQVDFLVVKLSDVLITGVHATVSGTADMSETVSLSFAKVELEYRPQKENGAAAAGVSFKYDLLKNRIF